MRAAGGWHLCRLSRGTRVWGSPHSCAHLEISVTEAQTEVQESPQGQIIAK